MRIHDDVVIGKRDERRSDVGDAPIVGLPQAGPVLTDVLDASGRYIAAQHKVRRIRRRWGAVDDHDLEVRVVQTKQRLQAGRQTCRAVAGGYYHADDRRRTPNYRLGAWFSQSTTRMLAYQ